MSNPEILNVARRFRETLWTSSDAAAAEEIIAPKCEIHGESPFTTDFATGPEAIRQLIAFYQLTFSDIRMTIDRTVAEGEWVAVHWTGHGRHTGDLLGAPPTGREVIAHGIDLLHIVDGQVIEAWLTWDAIGLLAQLFDQKDGQKLAAHDLLSVVERLMR